ncbi:TIGR03364 family FAD-dependent oxidoreductase [Novosphingobium album (ex Liu et al. 2023)]|uniref:TIGR03364 family FAD-dependent oxidoreductase n=1 Tax=Novosphingobium album (ex Liu et al. 2023) TaxID=3031130 RepID=A0ABT5WLV3_9SPHN|nr:TIGR03364 family FAD-dependent oxidoreductase [Novosphingobium album (ex Liu et al. 2023)]MDE8651016.1 TIGR03364 family FAD-dependent oxidoreductase [Novosphingobium album (ex Liu et al. 2023)]
MHDVIVVGAGIVGLAHALAAARRGKRVLVIDRDARANGASIRNFGFVTVTGQERGRVWDLARRSAAIWRAIAGPAGIRIEQEGLLLVARRPEAAAVLDAFLATGMGEGCTRLTGTEAQALCPAIPSAAAALLSPHDLRVESRTAIPLLAQWLERAHGVTFRRGTAALRAETGVVHCSDGSYRAESIILCPGDDWATLCPEIHAQAGIVRCKLQMMRLAAPGWSLPAPVMSDLSLIRYLGYAALPEAAALRARLEREARQALDYGIHLIVVQSADGSLVVGDSHDYAPTPDPFSADAVDGEILRQYEAVLGPAPPVVERWTGTFASASGHSIVRAASEGVTLVVVTSGTGASTAFALAEDVVGGIFDSKGRASCIQD